MIYKISGEQPFQVLSDSFSVSPSESGYNLYLSADGVNYSQFATVAANTTRQFTGMNNGNYYILSGNTSEVQVNWNRDCGGGGGGTAGVSSLNGQTGALTTKTVGGQSILGEGDIEIEGGGNYVIVDALSAITSPVEGMIAYVSGRTYIDVIEGYKCQRNRAVGNEGDVARIYLDGNELARVYQSGANFYWDWTNDGLWNTYNREYNGNYYPIEYKTYNDDSDNMNSYFVFEKSLGGLAELGATVTPEGGDQATVTDYSEDVQRIQTAKFYQYKGGEWQRLDIGDKYILDDMTTAERVALFNKLKALWYSGEKDFSQFKIYSYPDNQSFEARLPWLLQFYDYSTDGGGRFLFGAAAARRDWAGAVNGFRLALTYDGSIVDKSFESLEPTSVFKLTLLRDRNYLAYINGTFSGYTFDATNVGTDVTVCELSAGGSWLFRVYKDGNGRLVDGDQNEYIDDNEWHYKERAYDIYSLKCEYKRTGQTITVAFIQGGPASASEMQFNENVTYSGTTSSLNVFSTNVSEDIFYTGNTCSTEYKFEEAGVRMFADGNPDNRFPEPLFNFRTITADGETRYSNPVVSYRKVPTTVLYDANGNAFNFNERFYFNYVDFTISLLAGDGNDYRYAQLTVTAN